MKSPALWMAIGAILLLGGSVNAWGGLFNRFSPEMLANMGYGSHGGSYRPQSFLQNEILDEEQQSPRYEPDPCYPRACSANEYCCPGFICVAVDDGKKQLCTHEAFRLHGLQLFLFSNQ
uniref:ITG-containing peptide n=1 Tax=Anopheles christyi TaxID=43041 RepID=A0A182K666_9DIPT